MSEPFIEVKKNNKLLEKLIELASPEMDDSIRNLELLKLHSIVASEIRVLRAGRFDKQLELTEVRFKMASIRDNVYQIIAEEINPITDKKQFTNAESRTAEMNKRLELDDTYMILVQQEKSLDEEILKKYDVEIEQRYSVIKLIPTYLEAYSNLTKVKTE